jgi:hypothetical protein
MLAAVELRGMVGWAGCGDQFPWMVVSMPGVDSTG